MLKRKVFVALTICTLLSTAAIGKLPAYADFEENQATLHIEYATQYANFDQLKNKSDIVAIGNVKNVQTEEIEGLLFTNYEVEVIDTLKGDNTTSNNIIVSLTGGETNQVSMVANETKLLELGDTYLFALQKVWPDDDSSNLYAPCGEYQGIFKCASTPDVLAIGESESDIEIDKLSQFIIEPFNDYNELEESLIAESVASL